MYKLLLVLIPIFLFGAACEKDMSAFEPAAFAPPPGTPKFVNTTWTRSGIPACRFCILKLTTSTVAGATSYQWQIWMYGQPWITKTTSTPIWNVGMWGEGQTCFLVKVRAVNASGAGPWYTSPQKCPPANPPCCVP